MRARFLLALAMLAPLAPAQAQTPLLTLPQLGVDRTKSPWALYLRGLNNVQIPLGIGDPNTGYFTPSGLDRYEIPGASVGIKCDGVTDDAPAINAALAKFSYTVPSGNQTLRLQGHVCAIGSTISAPKWSGVRLFGNGSGNGGRSATTVKWIGAVGGTMLSITSPNDGNYTAGMGLDGLTFDGGNVAAYGIVVRGMNMSHWGTVQVNNTTSAGVDWDSNGVQGTQLNTTDILLINQSNAGAKGFVFGRGAGISHTLAASGDVNSNVFNKTTVVTAGGDGVVCGASDANTFIYLRTQTLTTPISQTAGLRLQGATTTNSGDAGFDGCRYNRFFHTQVYGALVSENGVASNGVNAFPAQNNTLLGVGVGDSFTVLDLSNGPSSISAAKGTGSDASQINFLETDQGDVLGQDSLVLKGPLTVGGNMYLTGQLNATGQANLNGGAVGSFFQSQGAGSGITANDRSTINGQTTLYRAGDICHLFDVTNGVGSNVFDCTSNSFTIDKPMTFPTTVPGPPAAGSSGTFYVAQSGGTCQFSVKNSAGTVTAIGASYPCP